MVGKYQHMNKDYRIRFWDKVDKKGVDDCWEWLGGKTGDYGQFWFEGKMVLSHRMSYALHNDALNEIIKHKNNYHEDNSSFVCVLHKCDNGRCCNPNHLFVGTNKDNIEDKVNKNRGQRMRGSLNGNSKLVESDIKYIRKMYKPRQNGGLSAFAEKYNISITQVWEIVKGTTWAHIK